MAEADGNRTRLTGMPGHYGFEDRARHQTRNASGSTLGRAPGAGLVASRPVRGLRSRNREISRACRPRRRRGARGRQGVHQLVAVAAPAARHRPLGRGAAARSARSADARARTPRPTGWSSSICPYCAVGCGQKVYVKDEQVIQIEGDPASPISRGRLCPKGSASKQLVTVAEPRVTKVRYRRAVRHRVGGPRPRHRDGHDRGPGHRRPASSSGSGRTTDGVAPAARWASPASEERPSTTRRTTS